MDKNIWSPKNLNVITVNNYKIKLSWYLNFKSPTLKGIKIERKTIDFNNNDTSYKQIAIVNSNTYIFIDENINQNQIYYYRIKSFTSVNESEYLYSNPIVLALVVPTNYQSIQSALNGARGNELIYVKSGTYYENIVWPNTVGIKLIGENQSKTIIDGSKSKRVITFNNVNNSTVINGFTITNGKAVDYGGGIYCNNSSPTISNVTISSNLSDFGGGIFCINSNPTISNSSISFNSAGVDGGGIYCNNSSPTISNVTISSNSASVDGGGIYCNNSNPFLYNSVISKNNSDFGGGIICYSSNPSISNVLVSKNNSNNGGGIYCDDSSPTISNVTITGNNANSNGGGIYCYSNCNPILINTIIWSNNTEYYLKNSTSSLKIFYSDIKGNYDGEGNINSDPLFNSPNENNFSLKQNSPCIDKGIAYFQKDGVLYLNLSADKFHGSKPDMGAYEYELK